MPEDDLYAAIHRDLEESRARKQAEHARERERAQRPHNDRTWQAESADFLEANPQCLGCGNPSEVCDPSSHCHLVVHGTAKSRRAARPVTTAQSTGSK
jgi:hypothetical protein